ncbi:glycosyltransferase [Chitinophaga sancti]|uniref:glycosyltransferase n=1 Tax=Chitinophaga sancti TaxID=1004 RepID=UPI003F7B261C
MNKQLNVLVVSGSYPPDICGVGDYVGKLFTTLQSQGGIVFSLYHSRNWKLKSLFRHIKNIRSAKADIIHMQYPTEGYGYSMLPQLIALLFRRRTILTLHELSNRNPFGKLATILFLFISRKIIFTIEEEQAYAAKICPWIRKKSEVINIGSNIPCVNAGVEKRFEVVYFGHIRPVKGIEKVIEQAAKAKEQHLPWRFLIVGQTLSRFEDYYQQLRAGAKDLNITWVTNVDDQEVSILLQSSATAYFPYPDGVSLRRGTFFAALVNGTPIITTKGDKTPLKFEELCYLVDNDTEVIPAIMDILSGSETSLSKLDRSSVYAKQFDWVHIAEQHIRVFKAFKK